MAKMVFCQITGRDISIKMCQDLQHSHDPIACFGCGACSRLCTHCRKHKPVSPEIGLCCTCIGQQLEVEKQFDRKQFKKACAGTAFCQIVEKDIVAEMCLATQGDAGCNQCPSQFRLCEECGKQRVFYPAYGLCLTCALSEYAPLWLSADYKTLARLARPLGDASDQSSSLLSQAQEYVILHQLASVPFVAAKLQISRVKAEALLQLLEIEGIVSSPQKRLGRRVLVQPANDGGFFRGSDELCTHCRRHPEQIRCRKQGLCIDCARKLFGPRWVLSIRKYLYRERIIAQLNEEANAVMRREGVISMRLLRDRLVVGEGIARNLIKQLEKAGAIGPYDYKLQGHQVICQSHDPQSQGKHKRLSRTQDRRKLQYKAGEHCQTCARPGPCLLVNGLDVCAQCARERLPYYWTRNLGQSPHREYLMNQLLQEVLACLPNLELISAEWIKRRLLVGRHVAEQLLNRLDEKGLLGADTTKVIKGRVILAAASQVKA